MTSTKIGFVLSSRSDDPLPSTRIAVLNMLPFLRNAGFDPHIVFEPRSPTERPELSGMAEHVLERGFGLVFFQKVRGESAEQAARQLGGGGVKTVFGVCDVVDAGMVAATDATACVTEYLKALHHQTLQRKIRVIHDGIENAAACKSEWSNHAGSRGQPLKAVLVTSSSLPRLPVLGDPPPWLEVCIVGNYPPSSQYVRRLKEVRWAMLRQQRQEHLDYLGFLVNPRIRRTPWDPVGVYEHMAAADIGIIPIDESAERWAWAPAPAWKVKSENRLTMKMSIGLPVIATPIPSYEAVIEQGVNGFLAGSAAEWQRCLEALRDPQLRRRIGDRARRSVLARYSLEEQARRLVALFDQLLQREPSPIRAC